MVAYKSEGDASSYKAILGRLAAVRGNLQHRGHFEHDCALTAEMESWVRGLASGDRLTAFEAALDAAAAEHNAIQAGVNSAIEALEAKLADLEL